MQPVPKGRVVYTVDVVQLVEHRIVVPSVVGSSPIIHPIMRGRCPLYFFCRRAKALLLRAAGIKMPAVNTLATPAAPGFAVFAGANTQPPPDV